MKTFWNSSIISPAQIKATLKTTVENDLKHIKNISDMDLPTSGWTKSTIWDLRDKYNFGKKTYFFWSEWESDDDMFGWDKTECFYKNYSSELDCFWKFDFLVLVLNNDTRAFSWHYAVNIRSVLLPITDDQKEIVKLWGFKSWIQSECIKDNNSIGFSEAFSAVEGMFNKIKKCLKKWELKNSASTKIWIESIWLWHKYESEILPNLKWGLNNGISKLKKLSVGECYINNWTPGSLKIMWVWKDINTINTNTKLITVKTIASDEYLFAIANEDTSHFTMAATFNPAINQNPKIKNILVPIYSDWTNWFYNNVKWKPVKLALYGADIV